MSSGADVRSVAPRDALAASLAYHFRDGTIDEVFRRHASVQYDPLAPLATSHDLVFAARVPDYRIDGFHDAVYGRRIAYDGWDKQASLVEVDGHPARRLYHAWHGDRWLDSLGGDRSADIDEVLAQLRERGPLEAREVELHERVERWQGSWYGPRLAKRILRALWHSGRIATARRVHGRHVYDLVERVVPSDVLSRPTPEPDEALKRLVFDRHRATGLLRPQAASEVWSVHVPAAARRHAIDALRDEGRLVPVDVNGVRHHAVAGWIDALESGRGADGVRFVAPLDPLVWDRKGVQRAFGFDYLWEVYKPEAERRWGWYVLPVVQRDRFVGRIEGAREVRSGGEVVWRVDRWWWEAEADPGASRQLPEPLGSDLERAAERFAGFLGASRCVIRGGVPTAVAGALRAGAARAGKRRGAP